jgi:hypothetical protein
MENEAIPLPPLPNLTLHDGLKSEDVDPVQVVSDWLVKLDACFKAKSFDDLSGLFIEECWWRDITGLSWEWTTKNGQESVGKYLSGAIYPPTEMQCIKTGGLQPSCLDMGGMFWVQGGFEFKNPHGSGKGYVRLANVGKSEWKAWTVFTQLLEFNFQKEVGAEPKSMSPTTNGVDGNIEPATDLQVLVVGAGKMV